jgi:uncharacterized membrane-anchored protein YjiN (DUF445 family)
MLKMDDIEERAQFIRSRIHAIAKELSNTAVDDTKTRALLTEMVVLAKESELIDNSLEQFHEFIEQLITNECSGPH